MRKAGEAHFSNTGALLLIHILRNVEGMTSFHNELLQDICAPLVLLLQLIFRIHYLIPANRLKTYSVVDQLMPIAPAQSRLGPIPGLGS